MSQPTCEPLVEAAQKLAQDLDMLEAQLYALEKETRASKRVESRDERAGCLQIGSAFASSPLTIYPLLEELHFFTVSHTLSFTLKTYHTSKEQKCFFDEERQSLNKPSLPGT